jgi:hypothetical protein
MMRVTLANALITKKNLDDAGLNAEQFVHRKTNTLLRYINVLFHSQRIDHLLHLNDNNTRSEHERKMTYIDFWNGAHDAFHEMEDDDEILTIQFKSSDLHIAELSNTKGINLQYFNHMQMETFCSVLKDLLKTRSSVKGNMTTSGHHGNDAWTFMQKAVKNAPSITIDAAYYFHLRCEEYPDFDAEFQVFMDPEILGSSENLVGDSGGTARNVLQIMPATAAMGTDGMGTVAMGTDAMGNAMGTDANDSSRKKRRTSMERFLDEIKDMKGEGEQPE